MLIHIITSIDIGGSQQVLHDYLGQSIDTIHKQKVFYMRGSRSFEGRFKKLGVDTVKLNSLQNILIFIKSVRRASIINAWMYHPCVLTTVISPLLTQKPKIIWSIHHGHVEKNDSLNTKISSRIASFFSAITPDKILFPSDYCRKKHTEYGFRNKLSRVVFNPIRYEYQPGWHKNNTEIVIGFCARNHPNKRYELFLKSAIKFCMKNPTVKFAICGKFTNDEKSITLVKQHNLQARFNFLGSINEPSAFFKKVDIYTSLSETESFGLTLLEAYTFKCKLVCTKLDVFEEILGNIPFYISGSSVSERQVIEAWEKALHKPREKVDKIFLKQFSVSEFYRNYSNEIYFRT